MGGGREKSAVLGGKINPLFKPAAHMKCRGKQGV